MGSGREKEAGPESLISHIHWSSPWPQISRPECTTAPWSIHVSHLLTSRWPQFFLFKPYPSPLSLGSDMWLASVHELLANRLQAQVKKMLVRLDLLSLLHLCQGYGVPAGG